MGLFLRRHFRHKNGKDHTYWSLVENQRSPSGKVIQRQAIYLGELDRAQHQAWSTLASRFSAAPPSQGPELAFASSPKAPSPEVPPPKIHFSDFSLHNPRQWGACWIADRLWQDLLLSQFWLQRLPPSREGTQWTQILQVLVTYRLIDPGSEFRLHREWFSHSAMADILGSDFSLAAKDNLYRCLDRLLPHREALFDHLQQRWWREQWGQICPFDKSLAGPKALRIDRSGPWDRVVNLTRFPLFGPSGYWGGGLESVTQRRLSGI